MKARNFIFIKVVFFISIVLTLPPARSGFAADNGVEAYGQLSVHGGQLVDKNRNAIQLRGMSSHGLTWFPLYINLRSLWSLKARGANLFRAAMYSDGTTENGTNWGYSSRNPLIREYNKAMLYLAVENAIVADMYVIADWHVLKEQNPLLTAGLAADFFNELSARYANEPGVLYEICNEPNGSATWQDIKTYAEKIIPIIRKNSPNAIVIVGTPNYSADLQSAMDDPLAFENVMYSYHFYTGFGADMFKGALETALAAYFPVFVSEWGISREEVTGKLDTEEGEAFIEYAKEKRISWAYWNLSNTPEDFSVIRNDSDKIYGWDAGDLSPSGKIIFNAFWN